jgi:hypothetical protein
MTGQPRDGEIDAAKHALTRKASGMKTGVALVLLIVYTRRHSR